MATTGVFVLIVLVGLLNTGAFAVFRSASVYHDSVFSKWSFKFDTLDEDNAVAYGTYNDTLTETGWGILNIMSGHGGKTYSNEEIMFGAGYLEAILTQKRIYQHYINVNDYFQTRMNNNTKILAALKKFFLDQDAYMRDMIKNNVPGSPLWRHASYILAQYDGLVQGYGDVTNADQKLDLYAFQMLNGVGDLLDLVSAINPDFLPNWDKMSKQEILDYVAKNGHCSALVKVLGAFEDVYMSHSSWFIYQATMRIYKHYNFNINDPATAAKQVSFSSYPGFLESLDDFYIMSSQLVMLQTTNNVFNKTLYQLVQPQSLFAWQRVRIANMMAHTGEEWAKIFAQENSGTYNNQYMIVDMKLINLNVSIKDGALWVVEQIPGLVEYGDLTNVLRTGYWPSYNVPYFERVYNLSGYPDMVAKHGTDLSYQLAPRAKIFRRDEGKVKDLSTMKNIMRYNDYQEDPYSEGNSCNAICCRGDLTSKPSPSGCYDTKVANYQMAQEMTADIINGPTLGTGLKPFQWTTEHQSHIGLPQKYNFSFIRTKPAFSTRK